MGMKALGLFGEGLREILFREKEAGWVRVVLCNRGFVTGRRFFRVFFEL
jgi:hypothetical protein